MTQYAVLTYEPGDPDWNVLDTEEKRHPSSAVDGHMRLSSRTFVQVTGWWGLGKRRNRMGTRLVVSRLTLPAQPPVGSSNEVGELSQRRGQSKPVTGLTGLWYFPGMFILVGPIVWFVKTNGALNAYWRSLGAS